jgi:DNA-binding response OmpR family regulator
MNKKTKVLIVEDEMPLMMFMVSILTQMGCDVKSAFNGKKAMELAAEKRFDLVMVNADLRDASGPRVCGELKLRHISRKTPLILISVKSYPQELPLEADDCITKPFEATELVYKVIHHTRAKHSKAPEPVLL